MALPPPPARPVALPPPPRPPLPPPPPGAAQRAATLRWARPLGVVIVTTLFVGVISVVIGPLGEDDHPQAWDPRVLELAAFVEDERGLRFDHPVAVDFLTPEEYTATSTAEESDLDDDDRRELDVLAGQLRALGVASGPIDLFAAFNQVSDSGTFAFYDPSDERVHVRGTEITVGLQATLVHELTHALQDQHFELDTLLDTGVDSGASIAGRALAEGDALRVEQAWVDELSDDDLAAFDEEYSSAVADSREGSPDVPAILQASFAIPYLLGQPLVTMLLNEGGNDEVDEAFDEPPSTEEHLFDPVSYLAEEGAEDTELDLDAADEDAVTEEDTFGPPTWYLVLAERIDPKLAFAAALGWAGDRYAVFERDDRTCVRAVFRGDRDADETQMADALAAWAAAMPGGLARAISVRGHPGLEACDPGEDIELLSTGRGEEALFVPALYGYLVAESVPLGLEVSRCIAIRVIEGTPYEQLVEPEGTVFTSGEFQRRVLDAYDDCQGSGGSSVPAVSGVR